MCQTVVVHLARGDINYHEYRAATASKQVKAIVFFLIHLNMTNTTVLPPRLLTYVSWVTGAEREKGLKLLE